MLIIYQISFFAKYSNDFSIKNYSTTKKNTYNKSGFKNNFEVKKLNVKPKVQSIIYLVF